MDREKAVCEAEKWASKNKQGENKREHLIKGIKERQTHSVGQQQQRPQHHS